MYRIYSINGGGCWMEDNNGNGKWGINHKSGKFTVVWYKTENEAQQKINSMKRKQKAITWRNAQII